MDAATLEQLKYPIGQHVFPEQFDKSLISDWIGVIEAAPSWLDLCIENLDARQLETPYRPEGWTINQVIHHMADSHMNGVARVKFALTENNPTIMPYNEKAWALLSDVANTPVNVSITLLHALHRRWGQMLRNLKPEDWKRTYYHPEDKRQVAVWQMTDTYVWHSKHHVAHIRQLRERMGW